MAEMTSNQRLGMIAQGQEPDRVPFSLGSFEWSWGQVHGHNSFMDFGLDLEKEWEVMKWEMENLHQDSVGSAGGSMLLGEAIAEASGMHFPTTYWEDKCFSQPHRLYEGDQGPLHEPMYADPLIKTMKDAEKLKPADPYKHGRMPIRLEAIKMFNKRLDGKFFMAGSCEYAYGPTAGNLMGWTQACHAMKYDLPLWNKVREVIVETSWRWVQAQMKAGARGLATVVHFPHWVGDDEFLSNPVLMDAEPPSELISRVKKEFGLTVGVHPCTNGPFLNALKTFRTWVDKGYSMAFAMPTGNGADDLAVAKKELAPAVVSGNLAPVRIMVQGSKSEVETATIDLIKKCAPGGRFMLGLGCGLPHNAPQDNLQTVINTVKKYGKYPIKI